MLESPGYGSSAGETIDPKAVLEVCLCHHLRRSGRALTRLYDAALAPSGLTAGQFIILTALAADSPTPAPALRGLLVMDRSSLSRTLKPLINKGFIEVSGGAGRRAGVISLTADGEAVQREAGALWRTAQTEASARLGAMRTGQLLGVLSAVGAAFHGL